MLPMYCFEMKVHKSDREHRIKRLTLELEPFPFDNSCSNIRFQSKNKLPGEQLKQTVSWHSSPFQSLFCHFVLMATLVIYLWFLSRIIIMVCVFECTHQVS